MYQIVESWAYACNYLEIRFCVDYFKIDFLNNQIANIKKDKGASYGIYFSRLEIFDSGLEYGQS